MSFMPSPSALDQLLVGFRIRSKVLQEGAIPEAEELKNTNNGTLRETVVNQAVPKTFDHEIALEDFIDQSVLGNQNNQPLLQSANNESLPEGMSNQMVRNAVENETATETGFKRIVPDTFTGPLSLGTLMSDSTVESSLLEITDALKDCDMTQFPRIETLTQAPGMILCRVNYDLCPLRWVSLPCFIQESNALPPTQDNIPLLIDEEDVPVLLQADQVSVTCFAATPSPMAISNLLEKSRAFDKFTIGQPGKLYMVTGVMTAKNLRRRRERSVCNALTVNMPALEHSNTLNYGNHSPQHHDQSNAAGSEDADEVIVGYKVLELTVDGWDMASTEISGDTWSIGV